MSRRSLGRTSLASASSAVSETPPPSARKSSKLHPARGISCPVTTTWHNSGSASPGSAQERHEIDVEKPVGDEQRLDVGLRQAERELRRLEARIDRHGHRAERGGG